MYRRSIIIVFVMFGSFQSAQAGDEVDYSAPYVAVENGELVTKYPAKEHKSDGAVAAEPEVVAPAGAPRGNARLKPVLVATGAILVLLGFLIRARRSRSRQSRAAKG